MIRNKIAFIAKETENRISSLKINKKICIALAAIITFTSIGISSTAFNGTSTTVLAKSEQPLNHTLINTPNTTSAPSAVGAIPESYNNLCKVTVTKHDKNSQEIVVRRDTVKKALKVAKVKVGSSDVLNCKLSDKVYNGMEIEIDEVKYKTKTKTNTISYNKFKKTYPDESTKSLKKDAKVKVNKTVKIKYVNGKKTEETVKSLSYKSIEPESKYYGIEESGRSVTAGSNKGAKKYSELNTVSELTPSKDFKLDKNGIPLNYSKKITGTASAYSCGTHTATGKSVKPGYIAVNPKQIPYGTKLFIRSSDGKYVYGYASAEDTGGFVSWGNTVADLFFWSNSDCVNFGRRTIEIYVLD